MAYQRHVTDHLLAKGSAAQPSLGFVTDLGATGLWLDESGGVPAVAIQAGGVTPIKVSPSGMTGIGRLSFSPTVAAPSEQVLLYSPSGAQWLRVTVGYDSNETSTPVVSTLNTEFRATGTVSGSFSFVCGNTKVGSFTTSGFSTPKAITSTLTGSAPFVVASTSLVTNLNADLLDGQHGSYYASVASLADYINVTATAQSKAGILGVGGLGHFSGTGAGTANNPTRIFTAANTTLGTAGVGDTSSAWTFMQGLTSGTGYTEGAGPIIGPFMNNWLANWTLRGGEVAITADGTVASQTSYLYTPHTSFWGKGRRSWGGFTNTTGVSKSPVIEFTDPVTTANITNSLVYGVTALHSVFPYVVARSSLLPSIIKVEIKAGSTAESAVYETVFEAAPVFVKGLWRGPIWRFTSGAHAVFGVKFTFTLPDNVSAYEFLEIGLGSNHPFLGAHLYASNWREQSWTEIQTHQKQIVSTLVTGTAPFSVASTTLVANLNADSLQGFNWTNSVSGGTPVMGNSGTAFGIGGLYWGGAVWLNTVASGKYTFAFRHGDATGVAAGAGGRLEIGFGQLASTGAGSAAGAPLWFTFDKNGSLSLPAVTGTSPLLVSSTTLVSNLNSDLLDGQHGSYYISPANHLLPTAFASSAPPPPMVQTPHMHYLGLVGDDFAFKPVTNVEYWDFTTSAWAAATTGQVNPQVLLTGRPGVGVLNTVVPTYRKWRCVIQGSTYLGQVMLAVHQMWSQGAHQLAVMLERGPTASGAWTTLIAETTSPANEENYHFHVSSTSGHSGDFYYRVTVESKDTVNNTVYTGLQLLFSYTRNTIPGGPTTPFSWDHARTVTFPGQIVSTVTGSVGLGTPPFFVASATQVSNLNTTYLEGTRKMTLVSSLRANHCLHGGGLITYTSSNELSWTNRFIVISNGRGSLFSTAGFFDITIPAVGTTITGVGGAASVTVTAGGIPIALWATLYYVMPIGNSNGSLPANFRLVAYGSDLDVPENWVFIANRNENGALKIGTGISLRAGQSYDTVVYSSAYVQNSAQLGGIVAANYARLDINAHHVAYVGSQSVIYLDSLNRDTVTYGLGSLALWYTANNRKLKFRISDAYGTGGTQISSAELFMPASGDALIWHSLNDGAGSTLDADLLDGQQGTYYLDTSTTGQVKAGSLSLRNGSANMVLSIGPSDSGNTGNAATINLLTGGAGANYWRIVARGDTHATSANYLDLYLYGGSDPGQVLTVRTDRVAVFTKTPLVGSSAVALVGHTHTVANVFASMTAQRLVGRYALTNGIAQEITLGSGLNLDSTTGVLSAVTGGGGTVTSVSASGGTTGLGFTGSPIETAGTLTLNGTLAVAAGGTGATTASGARTNLGTNDAGNLTTGTIHTDRVSGSYTNISAVGTLTALTVTGLTTLNGGLTASSGTITLKASSSGSAFTHMAGWLADPASGAVFYSRTVAQVRSDIGAEASFAKGSILAGTGITFSSGSGSSRLVGSGDLTIAVASHTHTVANVFTSMTAQRLVGRYALTNGIAQEIAIGSGLNLDSSTGILTATTGGGGTVTSVNVSGGTTDLTFTGGPITTSGTITLGGTLKVANGGTSANDAPTARQNLGADNASNLTAGTLASARISGSYTGITAVGTLAGLTVSGTTSLTGSVYMASIGADIDEDLAQRLLARNPSTSKVEPMTVSFLRGLLNIPSDTVPSTRTISTAKSITGGGDLSANRTLELEGDVAFPGNSKYYGTNSAGYKGFYDLTGGFADVSAAGTYARLYGTPNTWALLPSVFLTAALPSVDGPYVLVRHSGGSFEWRKLVGDGTVIT